MKMRILSLALAAALLAGGLTGCKKPETGGEIITNDKSELEKIMNLTGLPIAKEPGGITLKVFGILLVFAKYPSFSLFSDTT